MTVKFEMSADYTGSNKVPLIKNMRIAFDIGLKESKDFAEACAEQSRIVRCSDKQFCYLVMLSVNNNLPITIRRVAYIEDEFDPSVYQFSK